MTVASVARRLTEVAGARVQTDVPLAGYTTYRLGGPAAILFEPGAVDDVVELASVLQEEEAVPLLVMGRGSNLVVSDAGFPGVVLRFGRSFSWIRAAGSSEAATKLDAGAGTSLPQVANWAARRSLTGVEWLVSVPGSVGGAVRMNAGAHGGETSDVLSSATIFDTDALEVRQRSTAELGYSYRSSSLQPRDVVLEACFALKEGAIADIRGRMEGFREHRARTQPGALQNAGSVFKNPPGDSAGRLVENAGLKGFRVGGAEVSELHANFFVAKEGSSAQDVRDLVTIVRERVRDEFGIQLEPEIRFVGQFEETSVRGAG